jgi:hypothetical protein
MAAEGIVGDYKGSKAREVVMSLEQWEASRGGGTAVVPTVDEHMARLDDAADGDFDD